MFESRSNGILGKSGLLLVLCISMIRRAMCKHNGSKFTCLHTVLGYLDSLFTDQISLSNFAEIVIEHGIDLDSHYYRYIEHKLNRLGLGMTLEEAVEQFKRGKITAGELHSMSIDSLPEENDSVEPSLDNGQMIKYINSEGETTFCIGTEKFVFKKPIYVSPTFGKEHTPDFHQVLKNHQDGKISLDAVRRWAEQPGLYDVMGLAIPAIDASRDKANDVETTVENVMLAVKNGWYSVAHGRNLMLELLKEKDATEHDETKDEVNRPSHYNQYKGVEVIDITELLNFNRGNAVKYIALAGFKNSATEIQDLEKALWYVRREMEREDREVYPCRVPINTALHFCGQMLWNRGMAVDSLIGAGNRIRGIDSDLEWAIAHIEYEIERLNGYDFDTED